MYRCNRFIVLVTAAMLVACPGAEQGARTLADAPAADEPANAEVQRFSVRPELAWQPSGIEVSAGRHVVISASGRYVFHSEGYDAGPEGISEADPFLGAWPANNLTGLALIGKIGETGSPFLVGPQVELLPAAAGTLYFMVNDDILEENSGALNVVVEFSTAAPATPPPRPEPVSRPADSPLFLPDVGLRMSIPEGWQPGGVSGESVLASYEAGSGLYPNLNVTLEDRGGHSLEEVNEAWLGLLFEAEVVESHERTISDHAALLVDATWSSPMGELRALRLFVSREDKVLVVTFVDRADDVTAERAAEYRHHLDDVVLDAPGAR